MSGVGVPPVAYALAAVAFTVIAFPIAALASNAGWGEWAQLVTARENVSALRLSLATAAIAALVSTVIGTALALVLARMSGIVAAIVRALVLVPLVLPPVVSGIALLYAYGRSGPLAGILEALNTRIVFTSVAVVVAQIFVSLPFVVLTLEGAFRGRGLDQERTAAALGASSWRVFRTITVARFAPMIGLAALLAFARALGEFGATLTFAGSLEGVSRTLPLQVFLLRESDMEAAVGMSMILVLFSLVVVTCAYARSPRHGDEA